jgi:hypothetical protein
VRLAQYKSDAGLCGAIFEEGAGGAPETATSKSGAARNAVLTDDPWSFVVLDGRIAAGGLGFVARGVDAGQQIVDTAFV